MLRPIDPQAVEVILRSEAWIPGEGLGTGWRPEPPSALDWKLKALVGSFAPPAKAGLRRSDVSKVRDQYLLGACTGFSGGGAVETLVRLLSRYSTVSSPLFLYALARKLIGELDRDEGAYIRHVMDTLRRIGAAKETAFPYYELDENAFKEPPAKAYESARDWRLKEARKCETLNDVKRAISEGFPVVLGFLCYSNLGASWETGVIPEPSGSLSGGHAVQATEYDDATRLVSGPNSWGRRWASGQAGTAGWYHLPYSFFETGKVNDAWALIGEAAETTSPARGALVT